MSGFPSRRGVYAVTLSVGLWSGLAAAQPSAADTPRAPDAGAGEARLRFDQEIYRSRLSPADLERSRALQEGFHREWLGSRPAPRREWLPPTAPAAGAPVPPPPPRVPTLPQRFEQEAWDLQRLQQRQEAEASRLRQRDQSLGLPPGATLQQWQRFQSERAAEQLHFDMLRPTW